VNIVVWIIQVLLAAVFLLHGALYAFEPAAMRARVRQRNPDFDQPGKFPSRPFRAFIGVAEILAGLGLLLPAITGTLPWLIPLAAAGLAIIMLGAAIMHFSKHETLATGTTVVLFLLAFFVAYMRWQVLPL
jgi:uncharacterized membrane protein YphA (DoxX/SURF4 family)